MIPWLKNGEKLHISRVFGDFWQFSPTKLTVTDKLFTPSCVAHLKVP